MSFTLYTYPQNVRAFKSLIAAEYAGVKVDVPEFEMGKTNETAEYAAMFPLGRVPAMMTPDGPLYESNAMARYMAGLRADTGLLGRSHYESGQVDQWTHWSGNELDAAVGCLVYPIMGYMQYNKKTAETARADVLAGLALLNKHLLHQTFLVGERVTLADIVVVCSLMNAFKLALDSATRAAFPNVNRWFLTCVNQPQFRAVVGEVALCEKAPQMDKPKEEKKKEEKPKEEKKKEEKPKEKPKKEEEDDGDDTPKEEKPRLSDEETAWLAKKSPMDFEVVKRLFSNNKYDDIIAQYWAEYDHSTYTTWECTYKYNEDNKIDWMTCNYVGGVLQRLEESRKIAYGVFTISGEKPFHVQGMFVFKYKDVPTYVKDSADYDCFEYKQIDVTSEAGKERMKEMWTSENVDGRKLVERRFFK